MDCDIMQIVEQRGGLHAVMRKLLCIVAALCLCTAVALTEAERFTLRFDEGFALSLPKGWVSYPAGEGPIRYALGAGDGTRYLYILIQSTGSTALTPCARP